MRIKGKITTWNDKKGFGFISPMLKGDKVFVHITEFKNRKQKPKLNEVVTYDLSKDKQGRICAVKVLRSGENKQRTEKQEKKSYSIFFAVLFLIIVGISALTKSLPILVLPLYYIISIFTFIMYSIDKSAAQNGDWRTPESTLHFLSLLGGWPGAIIAQQKLRHKSKKEDFRIVFWVTVILNISTFIWLNTPNGSATFNSLIGIIT
jgi:uncharacterized membrane protein YsdA (DUF1294 family)/cold shock CspA family protein